MDMIWLPMYLNLRVDKYELVIIDECQDLNVCQRELMLKACNGTRFIAVGDKNQAIYGFAGADSKSFEEIQNQPNTIGLPLSECYRCDSEIIALAQSIVPSISHFAGNGAGNVNREALLNEIEAGDMVLCRNTFPLVKLCMNYLKVGKKAVIKGQSIGDSLQALIRGTGAKKSADVINTLQNEKQQLVKSIVKKMRISEDEAKQEQSYVSFCDKVEVIELLSENCETAEDISAVLGRLFSDDTTTGIQLSTIHRSKGLEAKRVFIIHAELMPSKYAKQDWQMEQEMNLMYVAYTRAKNYLGFVCDFDAFEKCETSKEEFAKQVNVQIAEFVGKVGEKVAVNVTISDIKEISSEYGVSTVYRMYDTQGNIYSKWGLDGKFVVDTNSRELKVGTKLQFTALIKEHKLYKAEKINIIKSVSKYEPKLAIELL